MSRLAQFRLHGARLVAGALFLLTLAFALQQPQPIPPFEGDDNSAHDGQPQWCQNFDTSVYKGNCSCQPTSEDACKAGDGGAESSKCGTYCRHKCRCRKKCMDTR